VAVSTPGGTGPFPAPVALVDLRPEPLHMLMVAEPNG
jgi:hypothetical protein